MDIISLIFLTIALSIDCFVVSVANGTALKQFRWLFVVKCALFFGFFHALMPFFGWLLGIGFKDFISAWDHWIALLLLTFLGVKMIKEGFSEEEPEELPCKERDMSLSALFMMTLASGIDEIGTGLMFVPMPMLLVGMMILLCVFSALAFILGNYFGWYAGKKMPVNVQLIGGLVLIVIGVKIFEEHTGYIDRFILSLF